MEERIMSENRSIFDGRAETDKGMNADKAEGFVKLKESELEQVAAGYDPRRMVIAGTTGDMLTIAMYMQDFAINHHITNQKVLMAEYKEASSALDALTVYRLYFVLYKEDEPVPEPPLEYDVGSLRITKA